MSTTISVDFKTLPTPEGWAPALTLDMETASATAFQDFTNKVKTYGIEHPSTVQFTTDWWMITPYLAEHLLSRAVNGNRKVSFVSVKEYARQMLAGQWKATGESGIIDEHGNVRDFQHRLYASYISGASFPVFIVTGVPDIVGLSSYIDSGHGVRTPADALYMAGLNGLSSPVAAAITVAHRYDSRAYGVLRNKTIVKLTNMEYVEYAQENPDLRAAARVALSDFAETVKLIKDKGISVFCAWKILEMFGADALSGFFVPLASGANLEEDDPVLALRNRLLADDDSLNPSRRLGLVIKAFNMHRLGQTVRLGRGRGTGLNLGDNETFPRFVPVERLDEAAQ